MNLETVRGSYHTIFSLGGSCWPAIHLRRRNLINFSGPLDWYLSHSLSDVNRLLENKFNGFMKLENMHLMDHTNIIYDGFVPQPSVKSYLIKDTNYNIISVHDFPILPNQDWSVTYPLYKEKLNRRIDRFLQNITTSESILFVRWTANYNQAVELQSILSKMVKNRFNILILQPIKDLQDISENDWEIEGVCSIQVPNKIRDNLIWDYILNGIMLTNN